VPLLTGLDCLPLRARAALERLNLLAFAIVAALEAWPGVARRGSHRAFPLPEGEGQGEGKRRSDSQCAGRLTVYENSNMIVAGHLTLRRWWLS